MFARKFEFNTQSLTSSQQFLDVKQYMKYADELKQKAWDLIKAREISNRIKTNKRLNKYKLGHDFQAGNFVYLNPLATGHLSHMCVLWARFFSDF